MKNTLIISIFSILLFSCGEDPAPVVTPPNTETTHTSETVVENPMDSVLMAEYMALTKGTQNTDSLKMELEALSLSNDSLLKIIMVMKDTMESNFPIKFPEPKVDTTDYNKPPNGDTKRHKYKMFTGVIPAKAKEEKALSSDLVGTYINSNNSNIKLKISTTDIVYTNKKDETLFVLDSKSKYTINSNVHILNYQAGGKWVMVLLEKNNNLLSFKIIPASADLKEAPTKKELKKYLEENPGSVLSVFMKVN